MIFHAKKPNGFVMVDKAALNDPRISFKAKGLLCYLLSKPPDWRPQIEDICQHGAEKETAVRSALQELAKFGYAKLIKQGGDGGRWEGSFWTIHERPESSEIKVSRNSGNPNLKVVRMKERNKNERVLKDFIPSPNSDCPLPSREKLVAESLELVEHVLNGVIDDSLMEQWKRRAQACPWRTQEALDYTLQVILSRKFWKKEPLKNVGGYANWQYLNCHKLIGGRNNGINKPGDKRASQSVLRGGGLRSKNGQPV